MLQVLPANSVRRPALALRKFRCDDFRGDHWIEGRITRPILSITAVVQTPDPTAPWNLVVDCFTRSN